MAAHRYWRLLFLANASANSCGFAEIELRNSVGGIDLTGSGTATASTGSANASRAVDNDTNTIWNTYPTYLTSALQWWAYDFGAGTAYDIVEIRITPRQDAYYKEAPSIFYWQYSDDGSTWYNSAFVSGVTWSDTSAKTLSVAQNCSASYYEDNFDGDDGGPINVDKWTITGSPDIQGNAAEIYLASGSSTSEALASKKTFGGDFDIEIAFSLQSPPAADAYGADFYFVIDSTHYFGVRATRYSATLYFQQFYKNGGSETYYAAARTNANGKLRIIRLGSVFYSLVADGSAEFKRWSSATISSGSGSINIRNTHWSTNPALTTRFDNYKINYDGFSFTGVGIAKALVWSVVRTSTANSADDGTSSGGVVIGGEVVEVGSQNADDGVSAGGVVIGGASTAETEPEELHQADGVSSGGVVFGGDVAERWATEPNNLVAVRGGTYRISGVVYTLASTLSYPGLGAIAALVNCGAAPTTAGRFRYDLLSIDTAGAITLTAGAEAAEPVMPITPAGELRLDHVLRYYGQTSIKQTDIGKMWTAPSFAALEISVSDDELAWAELTSTLTAVCRDQYGQAYTGNKSINASFIVGNGTISPLVRSGGSATMAFTYTRNQDANDSSPIIELRSPAGPFTSAYITLLDISGNIMT